MPSLGSRRRRRRLAPRGGRPFRPLLLLLAHCPAAGSGVIRLLRAPCRARGKRENERRSGAGGGRQLRWGLGRDRPSRHISARVHASNPRPGPAGSPLHCCLEHIREQSSAKALQPVGCWLLRGGRPRVFPPPPQTMHRPSPALSPTTAHPLPTTGLLVRLAPDLPANRREGGQGGCSGPAGRRGRWLRWVAAAAADHGRTPARRGDASAQPRFWAATEVCMPSNMAANRLGVQAGRWLARGAGRASHLWGTAGDRSTLSGVRGMGRRRRLGLAEARRLSRFSARSRRSCTRALYKCGSNDSGAMERETEAAQPAATSSPANVHGHRPGLGSQRVFVRGALLKTIGIARGCGRAAGEAGCQQAGAGTRGGGA